MYLQNCWRANPSMWLLYLWSDSGISIADAVQQFTNTQQNYGIYFKMTLQFNAATRINRNKMHKIVIEMFKNVDINNEFLEKKLESKSL